MKKCIKCGEQKLVDEFYRHPKMSDGHLSKCKTCTKRDVRENRAKKADYYKAFDKLRANRPDRVAARIAYQKTDAGKAASSKAKRNYSARNPVKRKAVNAVNNAVRDGRLAKLPCEICGAKAQAHHDDYGKPLDVRWLCPKHHAEWHKENDPICPPQKDS